MSIEQNIETMVHLLERIAVSVESMTGVPVVDQQVPNILQPQAPGGVANAPETPPTPAPAPATPVSPVEPAIQVPFNDVNGWVQYLTRKYHELGTEKGSQIHAVMQGFGYSNVHDVKPEHFAAMYQQIEGIQ